MAVAGYAISPSGSRISCRERSGIVIMVSICMEGEKYA